MKENKTLTYILFGLPLLVAGYFGYKAFKKAQEGKLGESTDDTKTEGGGGTGGGTGGGGTVVSDPEKLPFKKGKVSPHNIEIQTKLQSLGYFPATTAFSKNFGTATEKAVLEFQEKNKGTLGKPDGVVGKNTWKLLFDGNEFPSINGTTVKPATTEPKTLDLGEVVVSSNKQNVIRASKAKEILKDVINDDGVYYTNIVKINNIADTQYTRNNKPVLMKKNKGFEMTFYGRPKINIDSAGMINIKGQAVGDGYVDTTVIISPYNISFS